jgi:hypothetical protein
MKREVQTGAVLLTLLAAGWAFGEEPTCAESHSAWSLGRVAPVGGWFPYGGGLLHWWPQNCFPCTGAPDDYCRKSLPRVCWPPYPPFYIWGPSEDCHHQGNSCPANREAH